MARITCGHHYSVAETVDSHSFLIPGAFSLVAEKSFSLCSKSGRKILPILSHLVDPSNMVEIKGLHTQLRGMVLRGQLSARKIVSLLELREMVDRIAPGPRVSEREAAALETKYGARPEIITWGDYFQTEIASQYFDHTDEEFERICDTVHFDLISSLMIFRGKSAEFRQAVREEALVVSGLDAELRSENEQQAEHLGILLQYFEEMNLDKAELSEEDQAWFEGFVESTRSEAV